MKDLNVGTLIAFICPGVVGLLGLAYGFPVLDSVVVAAQASEQSIGVFLFAALLALAVGVVISGLRALVLDPIIYSGRMPFLKPIAPPIIHFEKLQNPGILGAHQAAVEAYYRYYQFYSTMAIGLSVLGISRWLAKPMSPWPPCWPLMIITLVVLLVYSAAGSMRRYSDAVARITAP